MQGIFKKNILWDNLNSENKEFLRNLFIRIYFKQNYIWKNLDSENESIYNYTPSLFWLEFLNGNMSGQILYSGNEAF